MFSPMNSKHFTKRINPNGVEYYVLSTHVAPIQQGFYFVNPSVSKDGRYLWFYCAFPPASGHSVGVVDFLSDEVTYFPETLGSGWLVDEETGNLYWGTTDGIFMRSPNPGDKAKKIADMPDEARKASARSCGTHLTFTADGKEIVVDIQTMKGSIIGSFDVLTGAFTKWYQTEEGIPYNHAQASPVDPDTCMVAHEGHWDAQAGRHVSPSFDPDGVYPRLQIIHRDGTKERPTPLNNYATHEWWAPDGKSIYYCSQQNIAQNVLDGSAPTSVCLIPVENGNGTWHAHCTKDQKYFTVDGSHPYGDLTWWRGCPSLVRFWNNETKKIIDVVSYNPVVEGWTPYRPSIYHIDPHPRFVKNDEWIVFTTTVNGRVDVGVAPVQQLIEMTK